MTVLIPLILLHGRLLRFFHIVHITCRIRSRSREWSRRRKFILLHYYLLLLDVAIRALIRDHAVRIVRGVIRFEVCGGHLHLGVTVIGVWRCVWYLRWGQRSDGRAALEHRIISARKRVHADTLATLTHRCRQLKLVTETSDELLNVRNLIDRCSWGLRGQLNVRRHLTKPLIGLVQFLLFKEVGGKPFVVHVYLLADVAGHLIAYNAVSAHGKISGIGLRLLILVDLNQFFLF